MCVLGYVLYLVQPSARESGGFQLMHGFVARDCRKSTCHDFIQTRPVADPVHVVAEIRVADEFWSFQKFGAEVAPFAVILNGEDDVLAIRTAVRSIRRERRMVHAGARSMIAAIIELQNRNVHPVSDGIKQWYLNGRSFPSSLPLKERRSR